jgi:hypothetical protein
MDWAEGLIAPSVDQRGEMNPRFIVAVILVVAISSGGGIRDPCRNG